MRHGYEKRVDLEARKRIAGELLHSVRWISPTRAYCLCPGVGAHSNANGPRDCRVEIAPDEVPTVHCLHSSCSPDVAALNKRLRSLIGKAECVRVSPSAGQRSGLRPYVLLRPAPASRNASREVRGVRVDDMLRGDFGDSEWNISRSPIHTAS